MFKQLKFIFIAKSDLVIFCNGVVISALYEVFKINNDTKFNE